MDTIIYDLRYSVDNQEPCTFTDLMECNIGQFTTKQLIDVLNLKVGEVLCGGLSADIKRVADRKDNAVIPFEKSMRILVWGEEDQQTYCECEPGTFKNILFCPETCCVICEVEDGKFFVELFGDDYTGEFNECLRLIRIGYANETGAR